MNVITFRRASNASWGHEKQTWIEGNLFRPLQLFNWYFEILHAVMDIIIIAYDLLGIHSYHD